MTEQAILEAVQEIFRDNFDDDTLEITRATCADDIEDWDSLEQINLLTAIEKKFNIKFKLADVRNLKNVGDLLDLVARMVGYDEPLHTGRDDPRPERKLYRYRNGRDDGPV